MKTKTLFIKINILLLSIAPISLWAQDQLTASVIAGGGGTMSSGSYTISGTAGQPFIGFSSSENNSILSGFWNTKIILTDVEQDENLLPSEFSLEQNYPNPFNPSTTIKYSIKVESVVRIKLYNSIGEETAVLVNEFKPAGNYSYNFNANDLASGVYFYRIEASPSGGKEGKFISTKKLILLK